MKQRLSVHANCVVGSGGKEPRLSSVEKNLEDSEFGLFVVVVETFQRDNQRILEQVVVNHSMAYDNTTVVTSTCKQRIPRMISDTSNGR